MSLLSFLRIQVNEVVVCVASDNAYALRLLFILSLVLEALLILHLGSSTHHFGLTLLEGRILEAGTLGGSCRICYVLTWRLKTMTLWNFPDIIEFAYDEILLNLRDDLSLSSIARLWSTTLQLSCVFIEASRSDWLSSNILLHTQLIGLGDLTMWGSYGSGLLPLILYDLAIGASSRVRIIATTKRSLQVLTILIDLRSIGRGSSFPFFVARLLNG